MYTATFQSGYLTISKMLINLNCLFVVIGISIHISRPAKFQNQNL